MRCQISQDPAAQLGKPALRDRAFRWVTALLAMLTLAGAAACAGPPSKGDVHGAPLNQSRNNVVILANEPTSAMSPQELVDSFLQALTGDQEDPSFSVAREYLTPDVRGKWIPDGTTWATRTKIVSYIGPVPDAEQPAEHPPHPGESVATQPQAVAATPLGGQQTVSMGGPEVAQIDQFVFFRYQTGPVVQQFTVKYLGPSIGWRIATPPDFRMVLAEAFKRAYQTYQSPLAVYLPSRGSVTPVMDQVYLTQDSGKVDYTYDALARAVLRGRLPSQDTKLTLASVTVDADGMARVLLRPPPAGQTDISDVQLALVKTFRDASQTQQLLSPTALSGVFVDYPGCTSCQAAKFNPENTPAPPVYWVCPQARGDSNAAIVTRQFPVAANAAAVCPANGAPVTSLVPMNGVQLEKGTPIAVKQTPDSSDHKDPRATTFVAAVQHNGSIVVLDDKNSDQSVWYVAKDPKKVTDLEWDPVDGSLWVVDNKTLYRVQGSGGKGPGGASQQPVPVPDQQVLRFKPSPDGLRAVVVSGLNAADPTAAGSPQPAAMVFITRTGDSVSLAGTDEQRSREFPLLQGTTQTGDTASIGLQSVTDAAWADGRTVVLLGLQQGGSSTAKLYQVYLDGSQDSTISTPEDAQPAAGRIAATTSVFNGHRSLWTFSEAPGPTDPNTTYSYFKRSGGPDSFQEYGWSPVTATETAG